MKKYERIISELIRLANEVAETFKKKIASIPRSEQWKELETLENELDEQAKQQLAALKKTINWYRQRAKDSEALAFVAELEETYNEFYEHFICESTDEEISEIATEMAKGILESNGIDSTSIEAELIVDKVPETNIMAVLHTAARQDGWTLHIIDRKTNHCPYVVCWNFNGETWDWGTYCNTLEEAEKEFKEKCLMRGFCGIEAVTAV